MTDATGGLRHLYRRARDVDLTGESVGADECWLALRGLRTLHVRLERHQSSALAVARWLQDQPQVARVLHPALPSCPGHEIWARDFQGASGLFSIVLAGGGTKDAAAFVDRLETFGIGYSWGGFESLAIPAEFVRTVTRFDGEGPVVRLHVGLEDPAELIEDLGAALTACGSPS